jgi:hypothetical protein
MVRVSALGDAGPGDTWDPRVDRHLAGRLVRTRRL